MQRAELNNLDAGDAVEAGAFMPGLDPVEPLWLHVDEKNDLEDGEIEVKFIASYFGVYMGMWICSTDGERVKWERT